jgi:hypothetical protein
MPGIIVAAKVWRWTPWERFDYDAITYSPYMQIGGIAPSYRGSRLNPYTDGTAPNTAQNGRVLKGQQHPDFQPPYRDTTNTGGADGTEGAFRLVDVNNNLPNEFTKWTQEWLAFRQTGRGRRFLEWEWPRLVKADGMWLSTANDCEQYRGRRPISWNLDAFLPGKGWHRVYSARNIAVPTTNVTWYGPFEFRQIKPVDGVRGP